MHRQQCDGAPPLAEVQRAKVTVLAVVADLPASLPACLPAYLPACAGQSRTGDP